MLFGYARAIGLIQQTRGFARAVPSNTARHNRDTGAKGQHKRLLLMLSPNEIWQISKKALHATQPAPRVHVEQLPIPLVVLLCPTHKLGRIYDGPP